MNILVTEAEAGDGLMVGALLAIDVRLAPGPLTPREFGAVCAMRSGTPLVIAGTRPPASPVTDHALLTCGPAEVAAACAGLHDPVT